jgi:L-ascorbate metabolism protein UlaG (beta-lactamase superfamily)
MTRLTYIGHATVLVEMDGARLLTDPFLRGRLLWLARQRSRATDAGRPVDAVLLSHLHFDHCDLPSLRLLGREIPIVAPRGAGDFLRRQRFTAVSEIAPGEQVAVGPIRIQATPAVHDGGRSPFGPTADAIGFLIDGGRRIYFAGDTDLFPEMTALADHLDVALLPVWGWGPTLGPGHLDPARAARALTLLRPRLAIPIHWGTLAPIGAAWLRPRFLADPPHAFQRHAALVAPTVAVRILLPGQALALPDEEDLP